MIKIPLKCHHWHASETAFNLTLNCVFSGGSFLTFQRIQTSIAKKPYFCDFSSGSAHVDLLQAGILLSIVKKSPSNSSK